MRRSGKASAGARSNALWGGKGNGTRSNGLWGGGSRGAALLVAALLSIFLVSLSSPIAGADVPQGQSSAYVSPGLLANAQANPNQSFDVIVEGQATTRTSWVAQNVSSDATGVAQQGVSDAQSALQTVQQQATSETNQWHNLQSQATKLRNNWTSFQSRFAKKQVTAAQVKQAQQDATQAAAAASTAESQANQLTSQEQPLQTAVTQAQQQASTTQTDLQNEQQFSAIPGVHLTLTGRQVLHLAQHSGILSIISNAPVQMSGSIRGLSNSQLWPWVAGAPAIWNDRRAANSPTIAVIDSGVDPSSSHLGNRLLGQVDLSTLADNSPNGDGYGHGTFVASIAAGSSAGYAGTDPSANIYSVDVMDDQGEANIADVIAGCDWVLANKNQYDIRVANLSLTGTTPASVMFDPLDQAVEKLWLSGVVVVAAAGNYNTNGQPSGVPYAPGNDPFVITVGATDTNGTFWDNDDFVAPWSAFGNTLDGFAKPDIGAPGRYMIAPVPANGGLAQERPSSVVAPGYMELSGTSFAAPVVSGAAAYLLALHPNWTPDQVKGALMVSATPTPAAYPGSDGVGELSILAAAYVSNPPNPNAGLDQYLTTDPNGNTIFNASAWNGAASTNPSWDGIATSAAAWSSAAWSSAAWSSAAWSSAAWASAAWSSAAWSSAAWSSAAWSSAAWANNASQDSAVSEPDLNDAAEQAVASELGVGLDGSSSTTTTTATTTTATTTSATTTTATTTTTPATTTTDTSTTPTTTTTDTSTTPATTTTDTSTTPATTTTSDTSTTPTTTTTSTTTTPTGT